MNREHLTPYEIDSLLDDGNGTYTAETEHLAGCNVCRSEYERAARMVQLLERLPYRTPSPGFSSRVMAQVRINEPFHVQVLSAIERLAPRSPGIRLALGSAAAMIAMVVTGLLVWLGTRADAVQFLANLTFTRLASAAVSGAEDATVAIVGEPTLGMLGLSGTRGIWFTLWLLCSCVFVAGFCLRLIASAARRGVR